MANSIASSANGIQSGATGGFGAAVLSTNQRVRTAMGAIGLETDVVTLPAGTGKWFFANRRVTVSGVATLNSTSFGQAVEGTQTGSLTLVIGDPRVATT